MTIDMRRMRLRLLGLLITAGLFAGTQAAAGDDTRLAGQLLVATEAMRDPRFSQSVILLLKHDERGAFGIMINRPLGRRPIAGLLADAGGGNEESVEGEIPVLFGGPVQPQYGFVIHSTDYRRPETLTVGDVAMTANKDVLRDIGQRQGPGKYLFALGYAGWGAGQLEGEIARGSWYAAPADRDLVFDAERGTVWEKAVARRIREM